MKRKIHNACPAPGLSGILILLTFVLSLQSCFTARKYNRPELDVPETYRADSRQTDTLSMATLPWEAFFEDALLQGYIRKGLENNLDIRIALQNILITTMV